MVVFGRAVSRSAMNRRTLLLAGAGTLAGAALEPAATLAAGLAGQAPRLSTRPIGTLTAAPLELALPAHVQVLGLQWAGPFVPAIQLRARLRDGGWGPWVSAGAHGHAPDGPLAGALQTGEPLWIGGARTVQVRASRPLREVRACLVAERPGLLAQTAALPLAQPVLEAGPGQPPIIARRAWARGSSMPRVAPEYGLVQLGFVHHTENPNGYGPGEVPAMLRAIYAFHRYFNGWNDIGYNFVIDLFGRIWEARAGGIQEAVVGAQAGGYNRNSTGIAVLGTFSEVPVSAPARSALERLLAWKLSLHGVPALGRVTVRVDPAGAVYSKYPGNARVSLPRIAGHRDADSTECPGNVLYGELPAIRRTVQKLAARPVQATLTYIPAPALEAGQPPALPQLQVTLSSLAGAPLVEAPVLLQARTVARRGEAVTETTVAQGVTDVQGQCLIGAAFAQGAMRAQLVRALYEGGPGGGAAVSPAVAVPALAPVTPAASAPSS
jgi:hypothetical protein